MGIIAVQQPKTKRRDPLDTIAKALGIASSIYGIKSASEQSELRAIQRRSAELNIEAMERGAAQEEFELRGGLSPKDQRGITRVPEGTEGQRTGIIIGADGKEKEILFKTDSDIAKETKKSLDLAKKDADQAEDDAKKQDKIVDRIDKIGKRYDSASDASSGAIEGLSKVQAAASNPDPSGATDLALLFGFMKSIDPGSVVRESEFKTAQETTPIPERVAVLRERFFKGKRLSQDQMNRLLVEAKRSVFSQLQTQEKINSRFSAISEASGVDPNLILDSRFSELAERLRKEVSVSSGLIPGSNPVVTTAPSGGLVPKPSLIDGFAKGFSGIFGGLSPQSTELPVAPGFTQPIQQPAKPAAIKQAVIGGSRVDESTDDFKKRFLGGK